MSVRTALAQDGGSPGIPTGDPDLRRLRSLLRLQLAAADAGQWAALPALAAGVRDEIERCRDRAARAAALAEVAHLQRRLELVVEQRTRGVAVRLSRLAAQSAYRRFSGQAG